MTKHPEDRAQRLTLKKEKLEKARKPKHVGKVRRQLVETIKEQETDHVLQQIRNKTINSILEQH